jgi:DNA mismatch repair protein MSH5
MVMILRSISSDTLCSLQIIQSESHPSAFNQGPGKKSSHAKENFSLFGLFFKNVYTPQGKARLRQIFLRPSNDLEHINKQHCLIETLLHPDNAPNLQKLITCLKKIKNLRPVMIHLHKGLSSGNGRVTGFKKTAWGTLLSVSSQFQLHEDYLLKIVTSLPSMPSISTKS